MLFPNQVLGRVKGSVRDTTTMSDTGRRILGFILHVEGVLTWVGVFLMGGLPTVAFFDANTIRPGCVIKICHLYIHVGGEAVAKIYGSLLCVLELCGNLI